MPALSTVYEGGPKNNDIFFFKSISLNISKI